jgi:ArsR family transcriptional regulator
VTVPLYQAKAEFFRTLGHPARIRVLELLCQRDHAVHELLEAIQIEQSNLSQQLAVLRRAGLVVQQRDGNVVTYSIRVPEVRDLLLAARSILAGILADSDALRVELQAPGPGETPDEAPPPSSSSVASGPGTSPHGGGW